MIWELGGRRFSFFKKIGCWHLWAMIKKVPLLDCVHSDVYPEACLWIRQLVPHPGLEEVPDVAEGHHGRGLHLQPRRSEAHLI